MTMTNPMYAITWHKAEKLLRLTWLEDTEGMTDEDFAKHWKSSPMGRCIMERGDCSSMSGDSSTGPRRRFSRGGIRLSLRNTTRLGPSGKRGFGREMFPA